MSLRTINLTDNVDEGFNVVVRDKTFFIKFPTTEEMEQLQVASQDYEIARAANDFEKAKELSEKTEELIYSFSNPVNGEEGLRETLKKENIKVQQNFINSMRVEFGMN